MSMHNFYSCIFGNSVTVQFKYEVTWLEFIKCCIPYFLMMECSKYLGCFNLMIIWSYLKLNVSIGS